MEWVLKMTDDLVDPVEKDYLCCWVETFEENGHTDHTFWEAYPRFYEDDELFPESRYPEIWWWEEKEED